MKVPQLLLICCLLLSIASLFFGDNPTDLNAEKSNDRDTHGADKTTQGTLTVAILEDDQITSPISWDSTAQVYDLSYPAERLRVTIEATGLESNRTFEINWKMFGIIGIDTSPAALQDASGGYDLYSGRITHSTISGQTDFVSSVLPTHSQGSGIPMNDLVPSSKRGCYWIAATISDQGPHAVEVMPSVVSESVRYGQSCPDEVQPGILRLDSDSDGWTDELEYACGTDPFDSDIRPSSSRMGGSTCIELGDDDGDGVRNIDDVCPGENASVDSTGCTTQCPKCADDTSSPESGSEDDINLTGSGDAADLVMVGGAAVVGGIGITTILSQFSGRNRGVRGGRSPQIELELELPSDSGPDSLVICADCGKDVQAMIKGKKSKRTPSGGILTCCPECGSSGPSNGQLLLRVP